MQQPNHHKPCQHCGCLIDRKTTLCTYCGRLVKAEKQLPIIQEVEQPTQQLTLYQNPLALVFVVTMLVYLTALALSMRLQDYNPVAQWWSPDPAVLYYLGNHSLADTWTANEWWRLLLSPFLHVNLVHVFVMLVLTGYIGTLSLLNLDLSRKRFWITLFACAVTGGATSIAWQAISGTSAVSMGLAPIVFGYLGLNYSHGRRRMDLLLAKRFQQLLIIAHSVAIIVSVSGLAFVDHAANVGAMTAGLWCGWYFDRHREQNYWRICEQVFLLTCQVGVLYGLVSIAQNLWAFVPKN